MLSSRRAGPIVGFSNHCGSKGEKEADWRWVAASVQGRRAGLLQGLVAKGGERAESRRVAGPAKTKLGSSRAREEGGDARLTMNGRLRGLGFGGG